MIRDGDHRAQRLGFGERELDEATGVERHVVAHSRVDGLHSAAHDDVPARKRIAQQPAEEARGVVHRDWIVERGANRHAAPELYSVRAFGAIDAQRVLFAGWRGPRLVDDADVACIVADRHDARVSDLAAGNDGQFDRIVTDGQRADLGPVRPLQVVPFPAVAETDALEEALVRDKRARHHARARGCNGVRERVDARVCARSSEPGRERRVAAPVHDQVAGDASVPAWFGRGVDGCAPSIGGSEPRKRERRRVELHVRRWKKSAPGVTAVDDVASRDVDDVDSPARCLETRGVNDGADALSDRLLVRARRPGERACGEDDARERAYSARSCR